MRQRPATSEVKLRVRWNPSPQDFLNRTPHTMGELDIKINHSHKHTSPSILIQPAGDSTPKHNLEKPKHKSEKLLKSRTTCPLNFIRNMPAELKSELKFTPTQYVAKIFDIKQAQYIRDFKSQPGSLANSPKNSPTNSREVSLSQPRQELFFRLDNIISDCTMQKEKIDNWHSKTKTRLGRFSSKTQRIKKEMDQILNPKIRNKHNKKCI
ncbi:unnamed protein product [Blepharisma stoltei]|uniref:Uncharacterized protein n=1 Tax=Blepharisma stoltei TaxID=1481888 RepID=A0AAU9J466_9CILI|nr:unnamed protein product [Blepharisma stoltei]